MQLGLPRSSGTCPPVSTLCFPPDRLMYVWRTRAERILLHAAGSRHDSISLFEGAQLWRPS